MKRRIRISILAGILLITSFQMLHAQDSTVTASYENTPFLKFIEDLEAKTAFHFYFKSSDLDSFRVTARADAIALPDLLAMVFRGTAYQFSIDAEKNVYITKGQPIQTTLPEDFFKTGMTDVAGTRPVVPVTETTSKARIRTSDENRLFEIGNKGAGSGKEKVTLSGYFRDLKSGEPISGAAIYVDSLSLSVLSDQYGYYALTLPRGRHQLQISSIGMKNERRQLMLYSEGRLNIELTEYIPSLKEVVVVAERNSNTRALTMGTTRLSIKTIKQVPVVFGEADVLKVVLTLPGVTSVGEATTGFNVRGGSTDQNLILFNDATIYNPSHLFGFFSAFNPDVVKSVELYKSAIPEKYGGRLSSVLDVTTKEGNSKKFSGSAGIGPLTSKLELEGPIIKDKTTFVASARSSYSDWLLKKIPNSSYSNSSASFYDADLHITHAANAKNTVYLNAYISSDRFRLNNDTSYRYGNKSFNGKWKHNFNSRFFGIVTVGTDHYDYRVSSEQNPVNAYKLSFSIQQYNGRADFTFTPSSKHAFRFGLSSTLYQLHPGNLDPVGSQSLVFPDQVPHEQGLESAVYLGDQYSVSDRFSINAGLRYSVFNNRGPQTTYIYADGLPRDKTTLIDSVSYKKGSVVKTYANPEIRVGLRYSLSDNASVKISYNTLRQYIHSLSNTNAISPTDVWKLSDTYIRPQEGEQWSLGFYQNFQSNTIETSLEVYYKRIKHYLDYKSGAKLIMNHYIETDIINSEGRGYGAELLIKKTSGKLNGWISYTYSRIELHSADPLAGESINEGRYYPANYDKPHSANFLGNYKFSHRYSLSFGVTYSTGRPITLPIALFDLGGSQRVLYSDRNQYRIPDYFRADLSFMIEGNHKVNQKTHNSWSFGAYNLTGRKNPYSIYFIEENGKIKGYKLSIFGSVIPFVTYNIRF
ncbi:MAG TPA: TonB-dependent receptor [Flavisolibacter sp.]|nr:TonB-dependent receptor [Flavisolibacter sp.]